MAKIRERLVVSKQTRHTVHMERFNLRKLTLCGLQVGKKFSSQDGNGF
jgi:hypothetical protein